MRFSHLTRPFFTHRGLREGGSLPYKYISHRAPFCRIADCGRGKPLPYNHILHRAPFCRIADCGRGKPLQGKTQAEHKGSPKNLSNAYNAPQPEIRLVSLPPRGRWHANA